MLDPVPGLVAELASRVRFLRWSSGIGASVFSTLVFVGEVTNSMSLRGAFGLLLLRVLFLFPFWRLLCHEHSRLHRRLWLIACMGRSQEFRRDVECRVQGLWVYVSFALHKSVVEAHLVVGIPGRV